MSSETMRRIREFVRQHPTSGNQHVVYDMTGENIWKIVASGENIVKALEILLTAEHSIISNITVDSTGKGYILPLQYTLGNIRSGVYTYNADKHTLE